LGSIQGVTRPGMKITTHLHLLLMVSMSAAVHFLSYTPSRRGHKQFYLLKRNEVTTDTVCVCVCDVRVLSKH
jgi:hypothetical protein